MMAKQEIMRLIDANGDEVASLEFDNAEAGDFWILYDGWQVTIAEQKLGEKSTQSVTVPIKAFRKLIEAMTRPQKVLEPAD